MITSLNGIRGIAVLLVFTAHTPIRLVIGDFGQQAVYVFFVLSSFLLASSLLSGVSNVKHYAIRRFLRIYPLYALLVTILSILTHSNFITYILNMFFLQGSFNTHFVLSVSWSLIVEIQMYILLPIILYLFTRKNKFNYKLAILVILFAYVFRFLNFNHYLANAANGSMKVVDGSIYEVIDIFMIGILLAVQYKEKQLIKFKGYQVVIALVLFATIPLLLSMSSMNRAYQVIWVLIPIYSILIYVLFTAALLAKDKWLNYILNLKILSFYAMISYSFYLIHLPILRFFRENFDNVPKILVGLMAFMLTTLISYILYRYWERFFLQLYK